MLSKMLDDTPYTAYGTNPGIATPLSPTGQPLTPLQKYNVDNLDYYQNKAPSDLNTYGGYSVGQDGVSTAALMDPDVAAYFREEYTGGSVAPSIQKKMDTMNNLYNSSGWNGVLQSNKDYYVNDAKNGVAMSMAHPEKQLSTGAWTWKDTLGAIAVLALPVGGMLAAGAGAAAGAGGAAAGAGAGEAAAGLGAGAAAGGAGAGMGAAAGGLAIDAAIPTVTVTGAAGGAGGLGALGTAAGVGAGAVGLGSMLGNGVDPNIPQVHVTGPAGGSGAVGAVGSGSTGSAGAVLGGLGAVAIPNVGGLPNVQQGGTNIPESSLPPLVMPNTGQPVPVSLPSDGMASNPNTGGVTGGGGIPNIPGTGSITPGSIIGGLGSLYTGYQDYKMNQADMDYYQGLLNKMMGMYQPGTPEADLMQKQMEAKDAAAGRNSQYGVRATNLAAQLAGQRAQIMTSPTFGKLAEASRGHYDSSLSSLSSMLGGASTVGNPLNNLINTGINTGAGWLKDLFKNG